MYRCLLIRPSHRLVANKGERERAFEDEHVQEQMMQCTLQELEEFDPVMAAQLQDHILGENIGDGTMLGMDFSSSSSSTTRSRGHGFNRSRIPSEELLQESNKREWVKFKLHQILVSEREEELLAMRRGFWTVDLGKESLGKLNSQDLKMLISGPARITPAMVLACIDFDQGDWNLTDRRGWTGTTTASSDKVVLDNLRRYIEALDGNMLRRLLRFATGSCGLPSSLSSNNSGATSTKLRFQKMRTSARLPEAHTCFNMVELPAYKDFETLKEKMDLALLGVEAGIGLE
jgi:hypothetical protein